ncbi:MAG: serine/threonine protein kinase [Candidatus Obscuribacterales bacterium]|nr:serine/threonine protein kinase [Candidatus Obscuribacterales bacterium]
MERPDVAEATRFKLCLVCPTCATEFPADGALTCCPEDKTLLAPVVPSLTGTVIDGRYNIVSRVSSGGWGEVFLARHIGLNKNVAIKILHLNLISDPERVKRFQAEAESASRLKHKNIVSVHDYGLTQDGRPFIVMEFLEGQSLTDRLKSGAISPELAVTLLSQLCSALAVAHEQGIIHRDIKPGNILINNAQSGEEDVAQLLDFGIAKTMHVDEIGGVTRTGEVLGTPAYMSPEQCRGQALDGRSDIYSLGCVFYEMLTGTPLVSATNAFDCMNWHLNGELPNLKGLQGVLPGVDRVLRRMLSKLPDERYQDTSALNEDLKNLLEGKPVASPPVRTRKSNSRLPLYGGVGLLAVVAMVFMFQSVGNKGVVDPPASDPVAPVEQVIEPMPMASEPFIQQEAEPSLYSVKELERQLKVVRSAASEVRATDSTKAERLEQTAQTAENLFNRKIPLPSGADPKLMVISVYEGDKSRTLTEFGTVEPVISYTAHPIILALSSYSPVIWRLHVAPGVKIQRIILNTFEKGSYVENPPRGVKVESGPDNAYLPYEFDEKSANSQDSELRTKTGLLRSALVGNYNGQSPIELGKGSDDFMAQQALQTLAAAMKEAQAMKEVSMRGVLNSLSFIAVAREKEMPEPAVICKFNGFGPIPGTAIELNHSDLLALAVAPEEQAVYGITNHEFYRMPLKKEPPDPFITKNKVDLSWLTGITYDSKRKRVIISGNGRNGSQLFCFDPSTRKWSILRQTGRPWQGKLSGMFYDAQRDKIFALPDPTSSSSCSVQSILTLSPDGQIEKVTKLDTELKVSIEGGVQMVVKDNVAVVIVPAVTDHDSGGPSIPPKTAAFDLTTGKLLFMGPWKTSVQPPSIWDQGEPSPDERGEFQR